MSAIRMIMILNGAFRQAVGEMHVKDVAENTYLVAENQPSTSGMKPRKDETKTGESKDRESPPKKESKDEQKEPENPPQSESKDEDREEGEGPRRRSSKDNKGRVKASRDRETSNKKK